MSTKSIHGNFWQVTILNQLQFWQSMSSVWTVNILMRVLWLSYQMQTLIVMESDLRILARYSIEMRMWMLLSSSLEVLGIRPVICKRGYQQENHLFVLIQRSCLKFCKPSLWQQCWSKRSSLGWKFKFIYIIQNRQYFSQKLNNCTLVFVILL